MVKRRAGDTLVCKSQKYRRNHNFLEPKAMFSYRFFCWTHNLKAKDCLFVYCHVIIIDFQAATRGSAATHRGCCLAAQVLETDRVFQQQTESQITRRRLFYLTWEYFTYLVTHCVLVYPRFTFLSATQHTNTDVQTGCPSSLPPPLPGGRC